MWVCAILYGVGSGEFSAGQCTTLAVLVMSFCLAACDGESSTEESSGGPLAGMVGPNAVNPPSIRGGQVGPVAGDMSPNPQDDDSSAGRVAGRSAAGARRKHAACRQGSNPSRYDGGESDA